MIVKKGSLTNTLTLFMSFAPYADINCGTIDCLKLETNVLTKCIICIAIAYAALIANPKNKFIKITIPLSLNSEASTVINNKETNLSISFINCLSLHMRELHSLYFLAVYVIAPT